MKRVAIAAAAAILVLAGCSSTSDEQSDKGPSTTASGGAATESTTTTAAKGKGAEPTTSAALFVSGNPAIGPGEPGKLSVVAVGKPKGEMGSTVPVVFRNNTKDTLTSLELSGTARGADGSLIGSGEDQGIEPFIVNPGEWAFGYVYFDTALPADAKIEVTARGDEAKGSISLFDKIPLKVSEVNLVKQEFGDNYVGIVVNTSDEKALDSGSVLIACFDAASQPIGVLSGTTDGEISKGGTASFSVDTYSSDGQCASYAVGASGYAAS